ncbi:hypothetical protein [Cellulomonas alba]|uniref:Uncharacterized protein n=1 Tax=Cellulomonas alba TaxID=3053467 RepID=A0ABT7SCB8_9CELL|nr:hypothetical protein [Cellulomonas alba]MDM7853836.1 hypothetical protein [Cellulomonas alba]
MADATTTGTHGVTGEVEHDVRPAVEVDMGSTDDQDLDETPDTTAGTTATLAAHLVHGARLLRDPQYPAGS